MKKSLRNDFTDALNEEISSRKVLDKAKNPVMEEDIFISENVEEIKPTVQKVSLEKKSAEKFVEKPIEKVSLEKELPKKIVITKADFEKRVMAEAENDFYEEIKLRSDLRSKVEDKKNLPLTFHSKTFDNITSEHEEIKNAENDDFDPELYRKLTRAETAGVGISAIMLIYSVSTMDKPLFFMALSLLSHLLRPLVGGFFGKHNRAVQNAMRSFSLVLFFGALLILFTQ